jgi:centromere protein C
MVFAIGIAWTAKMVEPRMAVDRSWSFDKIFGDDEFIAAGQLIIPPRGRKPSKAAKDNTYVSPLIQCSKKTKKLMM